MPNPTARQLRILLRQLEVPDCGCKVHYLPLCQLGGGSGCRERRQDGECDCAWLPGPPCEHIAAINPDDSPLSLDEWAELLHALDPEDYDDPPPPAAPALVVSRQARVAVYAERHGPDPDLAAFHLYHPEDLARETPEHLAGRLTPRRNGRAASELGWEVAGRVGPAERKAA